jgi:predicted TPR repeat methyltransferase
LLSHDPPFWRGGLALPLPWDGEKNRRKSVVIVVLTVVMFRLLDELDVGRSTARKSLHRLGVWSPWRYGEPRQDQQSIQLEILDGFAPFDKRGYPVVSVPAGYAEWARDYEATLATGLDRTLLEALTSIDWEATATPADLACGTGRTGFWLRQQGVQLIDGVDITPEMLEIARRKGVYRHLDCTDVSRTELPPASYRPCTLALADDHLADLTPVYQEAARLLVSTGYFILIGYHPFFLMSGTPTHYHRVHGEAVTIRCYVHLFSEHHQAGTEAGLELIEFRERLIDEEWLQNKPKWRAYQRWPVSFALVWRRN